jgi:hypothetical protein
MVITIIIGHVHGQVTTLLVGARCLVPLLINTGLKWS